MMIEFSTESEIKPSSREKRAARLPKMTFPRRRSSDPAAENEFRTEEGARMPRYLSQLSEAELAELTVAQKTAIIFDLPDDEGRAADVAILL